MKQPLVVALLATLPLALWVPVLHAQGPAQAIDASKMPESGPAVAGGNGQIVGPNSRNQAVMPMPGLRQDEELSELPKEATLPPSEVRPITAPSRAKR